MEAVRQIIDSRLLPSLTKNDIDKMLKGSVTESLIGVLPQSDVNLEDYRSERLNKYERVD